MPTRLELTDAEIREILAALAQAQRDAEAIADGLEDRFQKAIVNAQSNAAERIANIIADAPDFHGLEVKRRIGWWIDNQQAIEEALRTSGYHNGVLEYVNALPKFTAIVEATQSAMGESFITFPKKTLDYLRARQVNQFMALGTRANTALSDMLYAQVFGGAKKKQLLPTLKSTITGTYDWGNRQGLYEWHAGTYARTNHFKYLAELDAAQADAHGLTENFIYVGPVDEKTRTFCRKILAKPRAYTKADIATMDNGFRTTHPEVADVMTSRGGFNCRHRWLGVTKGLGDKLTARLEEKTIEQSVEKQVDVTTAPASFKAQKTIADAEKWAVDNGIAKTANYQKLHISFVNKLNKEMGILTREFPGMQLGFIGNQARAFDWLREQGFRFRKPPSNLGGFGGKWRDNVWYSSISFPEAHYGTPAAITRTMESIVRGIQSGRFAQFPGATEDPLRRVIFHEFGHALDDAKRIEQSREIADLLRNWQEAHPPYRQWIAKNLCEYSAMFKAELFSEGFVEYILSRSPREAARAIGEIMMRAHGRPLRKL